MLNEKVFELVRFVESLRKSFPERLNEIQVAVEMAAKINQNELSLYDIDILANQLEMIGTLLRRKVKREIEIRG